MLQMILLCLGRNDCVCVCFKENGNGTFNFKMEKVLFQDMKSGAMYPLSAGDIVSYYVKKRMFKEKNIKRIEVLIETKLRTADYQNTQLYCR